MIPDGIKQSIEVKSQEIDSSLLPKVIRRADNAAKVSGWASALLDLKILEAREASLQFDQIAFTIYFVELALRILSYGLKPHKFFRHP